jgi:hypothetical protein
MSFKLLTAGYYLNAEISGNAMILVKGWRAQRD